VIRSLLAALIQAPWPHAASAQTRFIHRGSDRPPHAPALAGGLVIAAILWSLAEEGYGLPFRQAGSGALAAALRLSVVFILDGAAVGLVAGALLALRWARLRCALPRPGSLLVAGLLCYGARILIASG